MSQVVSGDGEFNESGVRQFVSAAHIDTAGVDYQTIAITGPQSSGKSTLMNALVRDMMQSACAAQILKSCSCAKHYVLDRPVQRALCLTLSDQALPRPRKH